MLIKTVPAKAGTVVFGARKQGICACEDQKEHSMNSDQKKQLVATAALSYVVEDQFIGIGTGSTVNHFIDAIGAQKLRIRGAVSSSEGTTARLKTLGIDVMDLNATGPLDLYVDGADESDRDLHLIK